MERVAVHAELDTVTVHFRRCQYSKIVLSRAWDRGEKELPAKYIQCNSKASPAPSAERPTSAVLIQEEGGGGWESNDTCTKCKEMTQIELNILYDSRSESCADIMHDICAWSNVDIDETEGFYFIDL